MDPELTSMAATTVVKLLVTAAWEQAKDRGRLRYLVAADPQLADELRQVVVELRSALADADPPQGATITMQATTFGNSRVNQAGRDLHVTTGE